MVGDKNSRDDNSNSKRRADYNRRSVSNKITFQMSPEALARLTVAPPKKAKLPTTKSVILSDMIFQDPSLEARKNIQKNNKNRIRPPSNIDNYWKVFKDEVLLRWPEAQFSIELSAKDKGQLKKSISIYEAHQVLDMVRILVWDWETIRTSCFPFMPNRPRPTIENLWRHSGDLFPAINIGITDSREGRVSKYYERYVKVTHFVNTEKPKKSMLDRFRASRGKDD